MVKLKPLLPTLKEKKRYLAFEIVSNKKGFSFAQVSKAIWNSVVSYCGTKGAAQMGLWIFPEKFNAKNSRGLIKVTHKSLDTTRAAIALVTSIDGEPAIVRSVGVSGIMKKAEIKFVN